MNRALIALAAAAALATSACTSVPERQANHLRDREEVLRDLEQDRRDDAQRLAQRELRRYPDWALEPPPAPDSTGIYAVGIADSDAPAVALSKARLNAQVDLARQANQVISGLERQRLEDDGASSTDAYRLISESIVDWTPVAGTEIVRQEVLPIEGRVHAFVMVKLPFGAANRVLTERRRQATRAEEREAFEDLSRRLEAYRATLGSSSASP